MKRCPWPDFFDYANIELTSTGEIRIENWKYETFPDNFMYVSAGYSLTDHTQFCDFLDDFLDMTTEDARKLYEAKCEANMVNEYNLALRLRLNPNESMAGAKREVDEFFKRHRPDVFK